MQPITELFPPFGDEQIAAFESRASTEDRAELDGMFKIADIRYPKSGRHVLSTSLYCQPHSPQVPPIEPVTIDNLRRPHPSVRNKNSWWDEYMRPLIRALDRIQPPWHLRLHLAPNLTFLERFVRHPRVEIRVMKHPSTSTIPGMLWRYLPMDEDVILMARGTDDLWPEREVMLHVENALREDFFLFRRHLPRDLDQSSFLIYRTVPGPIVVQGSEALRFRRAAQAWIWSNKNRLLAASVAFGDPPRQVPKFGLSHWARYGQDEQFLSHWLFYLALDRSIYTMADKRHSSTIFVSDMKLVQSKSAFSRLFLY